MKKCNFALYITVPLYFGILDLPNSIYRKKMFNKNAVHYVTLRNAQGHFGLHRPPKAPIFVVTRLIRYTDPRNEV